MRTVLFLFLLLVSNLCYSQLETTVYYGVNYFPVKKENAVTCAKVRYLNHGNLKINHYYKKRRNKWKKDRKKYEKATKVNDSTFTINYFYKKENWKTEKRIAVPGNDSVFHVRDYYESGRLKSEGLSKTIFPLQYIDTVTTYYPSGQTKSIKIYNDNHLSAQLFKDNGELLVENIYENLLQPPQFPYGRMNLNMYLKDNVNYPDLAKKANIEGTVIIEFIITKEGHLQNAHIVKSIDKTRPPGEVCDNEVLRVVQEMPDWYAGIYKGEKVNSVVMLPVQFKIKRRKVKIKHIPVFPPSYSGFWSPTPSPTSVPFPTSPYPVAAPF